MMDKLTYSLVQLCRRNRDGSYATQNDRQDMLQLMSRQLHEAGSRQMTATSLRPKHIAILVERWQRDQLSAGTMKNRMAVLRWWAQKIGKPGTMPSDNAQLGIPDRAYVTNENKAREVRVDVLDRITDPHVRMSLMLQQAFGLRREECIKFTPSYADRGECVLLRASWTKGGLERSIPITSPEQRRLLDQVHAFAGKGSLIPPDRTYIQQRNVYDGQCKAAGLSHMHGLRHRYAQMRYETLTGWKAPAAGGPPMRSLNPSQREIDTEARKIISHELGHTRIEITKVYLGA